MSRGRRRRSNSPPAEAQPQTVAISDGATVEQVPVAPTGTVYTSSLTAYVHQFAGELLTTMNHVEIMRDNLAGTPVPQQLIDRLSTWIEALAVCHRHSGSVLAVLDEMNRKELGQS